MVQFLMVSVNRIAGNFGGNFRAAKKTCQKLMDKLSNKIMYKNVSRIAFFLNNFEEKYYEAKLLYS